MTILLFLIAFICCHAQDLWFERHSDNIYALHLVLQNGHFKFDFIPMCHYDLNAKDAYYDYLSALSLQSDPKVYDFYSFNGSKSHAFYGIDTIKDREILQAQNHLDYLEGKDCLKVFVIDNRFQKSYLDFEEMQKIPLKFQETFSSLYELRGRSLSATMTATVENHKISLFYKKNFIQTVSSSNKFITQHKKQQNQFTADLKKYSSPTSNLMKTIIRNEVQSFIDEGLLKSAILNNLDASSAAYLDGSNGASLLCMVGEIIMNGFKTGYKVLLNENKMLLPQDFFFSISPSPDNVSESFIDWQKIRMASLTTMLQSSYLNVYTIDCPYMKSILASDIFSVLYKKPSDKQSMLTITISHK